MEVEFVLCDLVEPRLHIQLRTLASYRLRLFGEAQTEAGRICGEPKEFSERTKFHEYVCVFLACTSLIRQADTSQCFGNLAWEHQMWGVYRYKET